MLGLRLAAVAAAVLLANAAPAPGFKHVLHEERSAPASDWVKGAKIEGAAILPMRIGLTQTNLEKGYDFLSMLFPFRIAQLSYFVSVRISALTVICL